MATKKSPLARQKDEHESKEKLVDRVISVLGSIAKSDEEQDTLKARLLAASSFQEAAAAGAVPKAVMTRAAITRRTGENKVMAKAFPY